MSELRKSYSRLTKPTEFPRSTPITLFMSDNGTQEGNFTLNVNGSVTPVDFWVEPPIPNSTLRVQALAVLISDAGNPGSVSYGNIAGGLTNGMQLFFEIDGFKIPIESPLKRNTDFLARSQSFEIIQFSDLRAIVFRDLLTFYSRGFQIDETRNEKFGVTVNDNLTALVNHRFVVKGEYYLSDAS